MPGDPIVKVQADVIRGNIPVVTCPPYILAVVALNAASDHKIVVFSLVTATAGVDIPEA